MAQKMICRSGLPNLGNTCYMSAILQVFFITLSDDYFDKKGVVTNAYLHMSRTMTRQSYSQFITSLSSHSSDNSRQQQDPHQFLLRLLHIFEVENPNKTLFNLKFYGNIIQSIICDLCYTQSKLNRKIFDLSLLPPNKQQTVDLDQLVRNEIGKAIPISDYRCLRCTKQCNATKIQRFSILSPIMIIHLARFAEKSGEYLKNTIKVDVPDELILLQNSIPNLFSLYAIVHHEGSIKSGHVWAQINIDESWFRFNDSKVTKVKRKAVSSTAYILYFRKRQAQVASSKASRQHSTNRPTPSPPPKTSSALQKKSSSHQRSHIQINKIEQNINSQMLQMDKCPICLDLVEQKQNHVVPCLKQKFPTAKHNKSSVKYLDNQNLCLSCLQIFDDSDWLSHRKNQICKKQKKQIVYFEKQTGKNNLSSIKSVVSTANSQINIFSSGLTTVFSGLLEMHLQKIFRSNPHLVAADLGAFYTIKLTEWMSNQAMTKICVPNWNDLKGPVKWKKHIKNPIQILDNLKIDGLLLTFSQNQRYLAVKQLNRLHKDKFPLIALRQRVLPPRRQARNPFFIHISTWIFVIKELLRTAKRELVHLGLDIYIILVSGQRFLADSIVLRSAVCQCLTKNKQICTYRIGKTKRVIYLILPDQLYALLQSFEWRDWQSKTKSIFKYSSTFFGFPAYTIKSALASFTAEFPDGQSALATLLIGHKRISNTDPYLIASYQTIHKKIIGKIVISNLKFVSLNEDNICKALKKGDLLQTVSLKEDWIHKIASIIYKDLDINQDILINYMSEGVQLLRDIPCQIDNHLVYNEEIDEEQNPALESIGQVEENQGLIPKQSIFFEDEVLHFNTKTYISDDLKAVVFINRPLLAGQKILFNFSHEINNEDLVEGHENSIAEDLSHQSSIAKDISLEIDEKSNGGEN